MTSDVTIIVILQKKKAIEYMNPAKLHANFMVC